MAAMGSAQVATGGSEPASPLPSESAHAFADALRLTAATPRQRTTAPR